MADESARPSPDWGALAGDGYVGAIDLGGTKILAAIVSPGGEIVSRAKKSTGKNHDPAIVIDRIADCVRQALAATSIPAEELRGVGIGAPGPVDATSGVLRTAPNLEGWRDVPLASELSRRLGVPVALDNDVRVAVIGEQVAGAGRDLRSWIAIWPGTGIGGGVVIDGKVVTGARNAAGEIGHITIKAGGPRCGCGGRGHLEALASRSALVREIAHDVRRGKKTVLSEIVKFDITRAKSDNLAEAVRRGDKLVTQHVNRVARYLAIGIASVANILNPEACVLGGGLVEGLGDPFVRLVERKLKGRPMHAATDELRVIRCHLGDDAGVAGAAVLARRAYANHRAAASA